MLRPLQLRSSPSRDHRAVVVTDPPSGSHSYFHRFHVSTVAIKYVYRISFISMHNSNLSNPFFTSAYTADVNFCGKFPLTTFFSWSAINEPRAPRVFESCNNSTLGAGAGAGEGRGAHTEPAGGWRRSEVRILSSLLMAQHQHRNEVGFAHPPNFAWDLSMWTGSAGGGST